MSINRRAILQATGAGFLTSLGRWAHAQAAIETTKIVNGFAAGGTSDAICRRVASKLSPGFAANALVENRAGASGQLAVSYVKSQPADGGNILQTATSILTIYPHIYKKLPYDPLVDLTPVSLGCVFDFGFCVGSMVPATVKTVPEFLAWAKANPNGASFGSPAAGSTPHFIGELIGRNGGVDLRHTPYRGTQAALQDLMGGHLPATSGPLGDMTMHVSTGRLRILGVSGAKRSRFAPDVATFEEQGVRGATHSEWFSFYLPAKASPELVNKLNSAIRNALAQKDVVDGLATFGLEAMASTPQELADLLRKDTAKWAPIVKQVGFTAD